MNTHQHKCSVCYSYSVWTKHHLSATREVGEPKPQEVGLFAPEASAHNRMPGVSFITCSDACRANSKDQYVKWLASHVGWNKKKAETDWVETIGKGVLALRGNLASTQITTNEIKIKSK